MGQDQIVAIRDFWRHFLRIILSILLMMMPLGLLIPVFVIISLLLSVREAVISLSYLRTR